MRFTEWNETDSFGLLPAPDASSHKYSRGVLGLRTGSAAYPGAAVLGAEAAWRTGIGSVRYTPPIGDRDPKYGLPTPAAAVCAARPETVFAADTAASRARVDAWIIGSGTDPSERSFAERSALVQLLDGAAPVVVDAGALDVVVDRAPKAPCIVTPHQGEFAEMWRLADLGPQPKDPSEAAAQLAHALGVTVLLKGSVTHVVSPAGTVFRVGPATPWLATAGTGDVLAGILGALAAAHAREIVGDAELLARIGATSVTLHDQAARIAAHDLHSDSDAVSGPITALEVAKKLPAARRMLAPRQLD